MEESYFYIDYFTFCKRLLKRLERKKTTMEKEFIAKGIVTAMLTPMHEDETVDLEGLKNLIDHMAESGMHGIFPMSTTGEFARLTDDQKSILIRHSAEFNNGRCILYIGISDTSLKRVIANIRQAELYGADVLVCTLPYYYRAVTVEEQVSFFTAVAKNTKLPMLVYNIPDNVGTEIALQTISKIREIENIVGIKDSSGDISYFQEVLKMADEKSFRVMMGSEVLSSQALSMGAHGLVPSLSNIYPKLYLDMYKANLQGNSNEVDRLQSVANKINRINKMLPGKMAVITMRKILLEKEGIAPSIMSKPYFEPNMKLIKEMEQIVAQENPK